MRVLIAILLGVFIYLLFNYGPEVIQYNVYRVYKEIKCLKERVDRLEDR